MSGSEFVYFHWTRLVNVDEFPIEKRFLPEANVSYTVHPARIEKEQNMGKETESVTLWQEKSKINNFQEYLLVLEKQEITHLLIDETNNVSTINDQLRKDLVHVFNNENEFPFLKKVYDSNENGFNYHVKLFKIDYTK